MHLHSLGVGTDADQLTNGRFESLDFVLEADQFSLVCLPQLAVLPLQVGDRRSGVGVDGCLDWRLVGGLGVVVQTLED